MMTTLRVAQGPRRSGVSLVWILVVGLFLIMGMFGLTKLRGAIMATNEAMVIGSLKKIGKACYFYMLTNGRFPPNLARKKCVPSLPISLRDLTTLMYVKTICPNVQAHRNMLPNL